MSVNFNPNDSSSQAYRKEFFADLRYYDLLKNMNIFPSSERSLFLQENGKKLSQIVQSVYTRYNASKEMFSAFCKSKGYDFSAEFKQITADESLTELKNQIHEDLNAILGEDHGINLSEGIQWKGEKVSISELLERQKSLSTSFLEAGAEKLGCKLVARKAELVYTAAKTGKSQRVDSSHLECLTYALYRLKEEKALRTVFFKEPIFEDRSRDSQLETFIVKLGYRLVQKPRRGDLIVYLNEKGLLNHAGVMVDDKTAHSKWGSDTDEILEHPVESIPEFYGKTYVFFRKEPSTLDQLWIL